MNQTKRLLTPVLLAPALLALAAVGEAPRFAPEEGTSLTKTVDTKIQLTLDEMSISMGGQEMPGGVEMTTSVQQTVTVTDTYARVGEGRPTRLERSFDELGSETSVSTSHPMMGDSDADTSGTSELEGLTVVFSWDEGSEEFSAAFDDDSEGDDELLEGLSEDMDLRGLLPDGEVAEGETWEIEPSELRAALAPGGSLKIEPEEMDQMGMGGGSGPSMNDTLGELEGEVTGTFGGFRDEDGVRVAVISLELDVSSANDLSEYMAEMMADMELPGDMDIEVEVNSFDMEFLFEGEGELLWNMETGLMHSFDLRCDLEQIIDMAMSMSMAGQSNDMEQSMSMSGSMAVQIRTEE